jgi:hypothetical protein
VYASGNPANFVDLWGLQVAPQCIHASQNFWGTTRVTSYCRYYYRIKILFASAPDSSCHGISPGQQQSLWSWGKLDGVNLC